MARTNLIKWESDNCLKPTLVAKKLGISDSLWSNIKSGRANPTYELLKKFQESFKPEDVVTLFAEDNENGLQ